MTTMMIQLLFAALLWTCPAVLCRRQNENVITFNQDTGVNHAQQTGFKPTHPERGYVGNCGPGGGVFNVSWYPKDVSPADQIKLYVNVVLPVDIDVMRVVGKLWYEGTLMATFDKKMTCDQIAAQVDGVFPVEALRLSCPIRKGQLFSGHFVYPNTEIFIGYDGSYVLNCKALDPQGRELLCINIKLNVLPFPDK